MHTSDSQRDLAGEITHEGTPVTSSLKPVEEGYEAPFAESTAVSVGVQYLLYPNTRHETTY